MPNARVRGRDVFGLLLLDKPKGSSSNQALQRVKRLFEAAKAGHTGSLDPLATGMLPIFFGSATRLAGYLLDARKVYRVTARLGVATDTGDAEGSVTIDRSNDAPPELADVHNVLSRFIGEIEQVPPMYSALKSGGVPLYRLARRGIEVPRKARRVSIDELLLERYDPPDLVLKARCSKGTYIRTLVEDIAAALGSVGHVAELRRLWVDPFEGARMYSLGELEAIARTGGSAGLDELLLSPDRALVDWPAVSVPRAIAEQLARGQAVRADAAWPVGATRILLDSGELVALGAVTDDGRLVPERVFIR